MAEGNSASRIAASPGDGAEDARANWFSDLRFTWSGVIVKKTGRRIGPRDVTPAEFAKFLGYFVVVLWQGLGVRLSSRRRYRVWFAPERPRPWHVVWSAATLGAIGIARTEAEADAIFYFEDVTVSGWRPDGARCALNGECRDISKSRVASAFAAAAGYDLTLNPATHTGVAVEKSEANGAHDGRLIHCPAPAAPGKCYQRFIDSSDGAVAFDYRTTVIGRRPLFVLVKTKPASDRFSIHNETVSYRALEDVFSAPEVEVITQFAEIMRLDWGALDILRDKVTGRIYIVDANKTDTGPAVDLSPRDRERLKSAIARAFRDMVAQQAARSGAPSASA